MQRVLYRDVKSKSLLIVETYSEVALSTIFCYVMTCKAFEVRVDVMRASKTE